MNAINENLPEPCMPIGVRRPAGDGWAFTLLMLADKCGWDVSLFIECWLSAMLGEDGHIFLLESINKY